jgi:hypothetical protein
VLDGPQECFIPESLWPQLPSKQNKSQKNSKALVLFTKSKSNKKRRLPKDIKENSALNFKI